EAAARIGQAFSRHGNGGLLHLGTTELETPLPPVFSFWRDFSRTYLTRLCQAAGTEEGDVPAILPPSAEEILSLVESCPPMLGLEYLNPGALTNLWSSLDGYVREAIRKEASDVQTYLKRLNPLWNMVGRVTFHLAENRKDESRPFAFLVTYTTRLSGMARPSTSPWPKR
ncbi:MAG: hypothetical protein PHN75_07110, partial [Syntrophales bacterium]|nr:hypothetical protein [Syntrophales bacterium]